MSKLAISATAQLANLEVLVSEIPNVAVRKFLAAELNAVNTQLERGGTAAAIIDLNTLIENVKAAVAARVIPCVESQLLIASADNLITALGSQPWHK